jgi:ferric-dicitrate binding protein FerR (iron transport regulator)
MEPADSAARDILWMHNKLSFDSEPLENVALKIERWFDVKVKITDDKLKQKLYTAVFEYENIGQVMEALRLTGNFRYIIDKKQIIIKP